MHETAVRTSSLLRRCLGGAVGVLLLCGSLAISQPPTGGDYKSTKSKSKPADAAKGQSLEELLAAALKSNPDLRVAEAKVREAEAELNRTRLQTTQKVVTLYRGLEAQKALVQSTEEEAQRHLQLQKSGAVPTGSVETSRQKALQARARLSEIEAELAYLAGQQPAGVAGTASAELIDRSAYFAAQMSLAQIARVAEEAKPDSKPQVTMAEKLRKALDTPVKVNFEGKTLTEILKELEPKLEGVPIRSDRSALVKGIKARLTLQLTELILLGAVFQLLEDELSDLYFVVREYGVVVVPRGDLGMHPPDAEGLVDFWKGIQRRRFPGAGSRGGSSPFGK